METTVLVITDNFDTHADAVCSKIEKTGSRVFRFNTNQLGRYEIGLKPAVSSLSFTDKEDGREVVGEDIGCVWYRRPSSDRGLADLMDDEGVSFFKGETKEWVKSITFALKDRFWVTAPWLLYEAKIKSRQLAVAHDVGLSVPKTLISMSPDMVRRFYSECSGGMVAKSLKVPFIESRETYLTLRTQEIKHSDLDDPSLYVCPAIFQERISVSHELRIVAIGRRLFAFKITSKKGGVLDIRTGGLENTVCTPHEISGQLGGRILHLLSQFDIPFSSMDFLVDHDGKEYFVDLNPNGQWLWLEFLTGVPMSDLFVEMLVSRKMPV